VYRLGAAQAAHAAGMGVVGLVGNTIPRELVLAAGYFPVAIAAPPRPTTPVADMYMEDVIPPETKSLFELAMSGNLEFLDLLVLSRPYAHLYYYLKAVHRLGRAPRVPPLHMFDLMQSQREAVRAYDQAEITSFIHRLEHLAGGTIAERDIESAIRVTNRSRALQRELLARRWRRMLSGVDALEAIGAGYFMEPTTYADTLAEYISGIEPAPQLARRPSILVLSSASLSHLRLHTALESAGALVVGEDDWWGSRAPGSDIATNSNPGEAILQKYWRDTPTSQVTPTEAREAWFRTYAVRDDVDGVVFYLPPSDRQLGWDYPRLKSWLDDHRKPSMRVRSDPSDIGEWLDSFQFSHVRA
jgi:benzoyl-CoA reductase/2-hydroxyglutaryl-CoA dehydratase subunit BcrC/BadD/HgdB